MNRHKVFIAQRIPREVEEYIGRYCDYEIWDRDELIPREELYKALQDKDGLLLTGIRIDDELLSHAPNLKVVSNITVGYNNFDLNAMKSRKVLGTIVAGSLDDTVADLIFGLMLSTARRIPELNDYVKGLKWKASDNENLYGLDVHHTTVGIIGMGRIGEAVAKRAKFGFDMDVIYYNRRRKPEIEEKLGVEYSDLDSLLQRSDFVVLMTPLTEETYHLMDYEQFSLMKSTGIFINASRGQTVNEEALIDALENKRIYAAGLDVFEIEPVNHDNPLLKMPNVVALPHIGSATQKTRSGMAMLAAENLVKTLSGEPQNVVPELR